MTELVQKKYQRDKFSGWQAILTIVCLLLLWAAILSIATLVGIHHGSGRLFLVGAVVAGFCGIWILALYIRKRKT